MDILADNLQSVIDYFGGSVPFDRAERWTILQDWENEDELFDFLDGKDDVVYAYLKMYLYMNILNYLYLMESIQSQNKIGV